jgi:hypothetical protein
MAKVTLLQSFENDIPIDYIKSIFYDNIYSISDKLNLMFSNDYVSFIVDDILDIYEFEVTKKEVTISFLIDILEKTKWNLTQNILCIQSLCIEIDNKLN